MLYCFYNFNSKKYALSQRYIAANSFDNQYFIYYFYKTGGKNGFWHIFAKQESKQPLKSQPPHIDETAKNYQINY